MDKSTSTIGNLKEYNDTPIGYLENRHHEMTTTLEWYLKKLPDDTTLISGNIFGKIFKESKIYEVVKVIEYMIEEYRQAIIKLKG